MLALDGVSKRFGGVAAVDGVTAEFPAGSLSAIIGPNGAGKTTLFNLIAGKLKPDSGRILLDGADIAGVGEAEVVRRGVGRAFQVASLFPSLTARESLCAAVLAHRRAPMRRRPISATATGNCSTSRWRWRWSRACCCSTNPPPEWGRRSAGP